MFSQRINGIVPLNVKSSKYIKRNDPKYFVNKENLIYTDKISDAIIFMEEKNQDIFLLGFQEYII